MIRKRSRGKPNFAQKRFLISTLIALVFLAVFSVTWFSRDKTAESQTLAETAVETIAENPQKTFEKVSPKQYSDKHISKNAVASNLNLERNSMLEEERDSLVANVGRSIQIKEKTAEENNKETKLEAGTWLWTPI